jgi:hypothetical protein
VGTKSALSQNDVLILESCRADSTLLELMQILNRSDRTKFRDGLVKPLVGAGLLQLTIPDRPRSRMQRYRTTEAGIAALAQSGTGDDGQRA